MKENKICKKCGIERELKYFYKRKDAKFGFEKPTGFCKFCIGIKDPYKITKRKPVDERPSKKEMTAFIDEMNEKNGYFDFVDCLRLVDIFTRQNGIILTTLPIENELMYMWEELKTQNRKK